MEHLAAPLLAAVLKVCRRSAILLRAGCPLCSVEHRVHLSLSGLWIFTTRCDTINSGCDASAVVRRVGPLVQGWTARTVMRKTVFLSLVLAGVAVGMLATLQDDWATRIVMYMMGALFGAAVGGALTRRTSRTDHSEPVDPPPGMGTSTADIAANYWRDKGHPPFMKPPSSPPDQHMHDPDRLV